MSKIKVIEIDYDTESIECPVCNETVAILPQDDEAILNPCEHTLFIATDYGYEYTSEKFNKHMNVPEGDSEYRGDADHIDEFTSQVTLKGAIKYAAYTPTPGCLGVYYGFAP
jgi:hypothetical protein